MPSWKSLNIRSKILIASLPALIPMLTIVVVTYRSGKSDSLENSERFGQLIIESGAAKLDGLFAQQAATFADWVREDVYGLAIEFETTKELGDRFEEMLTGAPAMAMLVLTDPQGKVLVANAREVDVSPLDGETLRTPAAPQHGAAYSVAMTENPELVKLGFPSPTTLQFGFACADSSGQTAGYLLAYLNWQEVTTRVGEINTSLVGCGFASAKTILIDNQTQLLLDHSDASRRLQTFEADAPLTAWLQAEDNAGQTRSFAVGRTSTFVTTAPIQFTEPPSADVETPSGADAEPPPSAATTWRLATLVPESDILAGVQTTLRLSIMLTVVGTGVLLGLIWFAGGRVSKPIRATADALKDIAQGEGDLYPTLECGQSGRAWRDGGLV